MNLSLSILLSSIILGLVVLYVNTKDRWKWAKILKLVIAIPLSLALIAVAGVFLYTKISDRPRKQTEFWQISLSDTKEDVLFKKGKPIEEESDNLWSYIIEVGMYIVGFYDGKVIEIAYTDISNKSNPFAEFLPGPTIQGIGFNESSDAVTRKFGSPASIVESKKGLARMYYFPQYNVWFTLEKDSVRVYGIYNPEYAAQAHLVVKDPSVGNPKSQK